MSLCSTLIASLPLYSIPYINSDTITGRCCHDLVNSRQFCVQILPSVLVQVAPNTLPGVHFQVNDTIHYRMQNDRGEACVNGSPEHPTKWAVVKTWTGPDRPEVVFSVSTCSENSLLLGS